MKKLILLSAIILSCAGLANAQSGSYGGNDIRQIYSMNYQINTPLGSSRDFISNASFEGININWAYFLTKEIAVGVDLSYNNYNRSVGQRVYSDEPSIYPIEINTLTQRGVYLVRITAGNGNIYQGKVVVK